MAEWLPNQILNPRSELRSHVATFNLQLCKLGGVRCQASASYHRVAPQANFNRDAAFNVDELLVELEPGASR